jgi:hypothetical protein
VSDITEKRHGKQMAKPEEDAAADKEKKNKSER